MLSVSCEVLGNVADSYVHLSTELENEVFGAWERAVAELGADKAAKLLRLNLQNVFEELGDFVVPLWAAQVLERADRREKPQERRLPMRNLELAKLYYGSRGGQARAKVARRVDEALQSLFASAKATHGTETAVQMLFWLVSHDAEVPCVPEWLKELFAAHKQNLYPA